MDERKQKIEELIRTSSKHFAGMVKRNKELWDWVQEHTKVVSENTSEVIYSALIQDDGMCKNGKLKSFNSINYGWREFCGKGKDCQCANESKRLKVSATKAKRTQEEIDAENIKREKTILDKSGGLYSNNGQSEKAIQAHKDFYSDEEKVKKVVGGIKETNIERYGVSNVKKIGISDFALDIIDNEEKFKKYIESKRSTKEILDELNVSGFLLYDRLKKYNIEWKSTNTVYKSKAELEILTYIQSTYNDEVISGDRMQIWPNELDIYIPKLKLAIEYCGLFWHNDNFKDKNYHMKKFLNCKEKGIKLITIFEDEWLNNEHIVKQRLLHVLPNNKKSLYARNCVVKEITHSVSNEFVNKFHLQGKYNAAYNLGLYHNNELVSIMTFGKSRFNRNFEYELVRFCSSELVSGAAGKLFSYFVKNYKPNSIVSYSDNRWGDGGLYEKLGFEKVDKKVVPTYYYTDYQYRYNRQKFQKHKLVKEGFDQNKSESEIMKERGFGRIWDCGQTTWGWNNS